MTDDQREANTQTYLGDGLYARFDGYQVWLETPQGSSVALEPAVIVRFNAYIQSLRDEYGNQDWAK